MKHFAQLIFVLFSLTLFAACGNPVPTPTDAPPQVISTRAPTRTRVSAANTSTPTRMPPTLTPSATRVPATVTPVPTNTRPAPSNNSFTLDIEPFADDFKRPVFVTHAGDGTGRLFVAEQIGRIFIVENGKKIAKPFLDIRDKITTGGNEQGFLGLAFHPDYKNNGLFFVNYSRAKDGANVIERYQVSANANVADADSAQTILTVEGLEANHNGGMLAFGRDGYLYIATGYGGGGGGRSRRHWQWASVEYAARKNFAD